MVMAISQQRDDILAKVSALAKQRLDEDEAQRLEPFIHAFYRRTPIEDMIQRSIAELYGSVLSLWRLAKDKGPGNCKVRVFNPQVEEHGWKPDHTIVQIVTDDMPFLVDSALVFLHEQNQIVHQIIHPVACLKQDGDGAIRMCDDDEAEESVVTSLMHIEIDEQTLPEALDGLAKGMEKVLTDVRYAVEDWRGMLEKCKSVVAGLKENPPPLEDEELNEGIAFLDWLIGNHFTFLGYQQFDYCLEAGKEEFCQVPETGMGVLKRPGVHVLSSITESGQMTSEVREFIQQPQLVIVTKANAKSTVHRPVNMDYIGIKRFDKDGNAVGEHRFVGLFTSSAYHHDPRDIPHLRLKVRQTLEKARFRPASHDGKALLNILQNFPRDELFQIGGDELFDMAMGILELEQRPRPKLFVRHDKFGRFMSCLVYIMRDRYNTDVRKRIELILCKGFSGTIQAFYTQVGDSVLARLHFIVKTIPGRAGAPDLALLEQEITQATRLWTDDLRDACVDHWGEAEGLRRWNLFGDAFPVAYREAFMPRVGVLDIERMEVLKGYNDVTLNLYKPLEDPADILRLKIYRSGLSVPLSGILPMMENMGLLVLEERPFEVEPRSIDDPVWVHEFMLRVPKGIELDLTTMRDKFQDAFEQVWHGNVENDGYNRLVLVAGLTWRDVVMLRAYSKFLRQTGVTFSQRYLTETLVNNPAVVKLIVALFAARFDPHHHHHDDKNKVAALLSEIDQELDQVASLDEDRILRRYVDLIRNTLRTNYYQPDAQGNPKPYVSFKLDSQKVMGLPLPRPRVEIFVYSPRVEGVHLRGGKVARGGLRWSDRREDFRTEVLGLMKAQMVKNSLIVPEGAKGGFVCKKLPETDDRAKIQEEVVACYTTFIQALLDITDNYQGMDVIPPQHVVRHDEDDPYLVVAADKGTATFSDIANGVALRYGFWLGDAFASGGSAGYDHKKMGITARGAWESVKRHFRELGLDTQTTDFTVVGIGDMAGDVFGNGMLCSEHIRLLGAFNHMHIFVDPDPDTASSFKERQRMFELPRSTWMDYDQSLISKGGGIFERRAKSIPISPEMKKAFGITEDTMAPNDLIRALLKAEVDLLWIGGIGTYVKASYESNAQVGDKANDGLRIDGLELGCKVVGEGGNLGFTQQGRIQYAMTGGRINTDSIDNAGGVDCSDNEVNIKIALGAVVDDGEMTDKQRNRLLGEMTDEVADLVLYDVYLQTQSMSMMTALGGAAFEPQVRLMRFLEQKASLNREIEGLPDDSQIEERFTVNRALTRPELAVVLSYTKMYLYKQLLANDLPDNPYMAQELLGYFPKPISKKYPDAMNNHRLRREIIATCIANDVVNRVGPTLLNDIADETGSSLLDVVRAYVVVREVFDLTRLWQEIEALDNKVQARVQTSMLLDTTMLVKYGIQWFLRNGHSPLDIQAEVNSYKVGVAELVTSIEDSLSTVDAARFKERLNELTEAGVPEDLGRRVAALDALSAAPDVVHVASDTGLAVAEVGSVYFSLGAELGLDWLRASSERMAFNDHWDIQAVSEIVSDISAQQRALARNVLVTKGGKARKGKAKEIAELLPEWLEQHADQVGRVRQLVLEFKDAGEVSIPKLAIVNRQLRRVIVD